jgi:O-antigen/teichoic acid export membrane protein
MKEPRVLDSAYYGPLGIGCLSVYFIITSAGLLFFAIDRAANGEHDKIIWILGMLAFLVLVLPIVVLLRAAKRYTTWKQWAEERGWVEPSRKERAWKKGDT